MEAAVVCYTKAVEMGTGKVITNGLGQFYSGLGQIFYLQQQDKLAEEYLEKAVSCLKRHGYYWGLERAEAYMAMLLWRENRKEEARDYYRDSKELSDKIKNPTTMRLLEEIQSYITG